MEVLSLVNGAGSPDIVTALCQQGLRLESPIKQSVAVTVIRDVAAYFRLNRGRNTPTSWAERKTGGIGPHALFLRCGHSGWESALVVFMVRDDSRSTLAMSPCASNGARTLASLSK